MTALALPTKQARQLLAGWKWRASYLLGTPVPAHYEQPVAETIKRVRRQTMTSAARIAALCDAVDYLVEGEIEGEIVECGVWKGGSMMAAALSLLRHDVRDRELHLFDTFEGMPEPGENDVSSAYDGYPLHRRWRLHQRTGSGWVGVPADQVRAAVESTGYPPEHIHLHPGMVEDTVPAEAPEKIALLRLDTDWYESTKHELVELYPRLVEGGVLIIDDYGHYEGARRAVDEYFAETGRPVLLGRIDYTGRIVVKPAAS